jgi:ArsR family transcriptional regulator, arsenate/arsenite/antimonite-responsive transcriptional repressor
MAMNGSGTEPLTTAPALGCTPTIRREVLSEAEATDLATAFHALADPTRLRLLNLIATADGGQACACDLVGPVERSQPTVSHHLKVLREAGLVRATKRGTWVWYAVDAARVDALRRALGRR